MINFKIIPSVFLLGFLVLSSFTLKENRKINIVFIGDSITRGAGIKEPATHAPPFFATQYLLTLPDSLKVKFSNQGVSGFTTVDFLPATGTVFKRVMTAADAFYSDKSATLVFSVMLGTNDSAITGPHGSPVSADGYHANLKTIADSLLSAYPNCKIVINYPVWYSPNTHNRSTYMQEGLTRLQTYFPEIDKLVKEYRKTHKGHVFIGDRDAFNYFKEHYLTDLQAEKGQDGTFYLHPNEAGAVVLGNYWGKAIWKILK